ncbi:uncharacterized protein LOC125210142 isoform X2 [Salvia hispanica]|uniref:uncharacterized protein LOC125210142 isoform X2 n=1 Tax=Salvia hispanica TaxID=49212 RepID=UPI002009AA9C|nr:uncharacterized protein LOC125210142 isoform X2 [Salvia hispanica]
MDKFLDPSATTLFDKTKSVKRCPWKRSLVELNGRADPNYRHYISTLIIDSYSKKGAFPHNYHVNGEPCQTHASWFMNAGMGDYSSARQGISSVEFDSKGVYLASVTKSGCLTVHDFDNIRSADSKEDEDKQLLHISTSQQIDVVKWNLANQDEIACTSMRSSEIHIYDIGYISSEPVEVLKKRPNITVHGLNVHKGFSDIAFSSDDNSRLLASDSSGVINIWDRRVSDRPCLELTTNSTGLLNSIKLSRDNEIVFGASKQGSIFIWDLRGGKSLSTFKNHKEEYHSPLITVKLAPELEKISPLKAQSSIVPKEIHSIDINPSCPYQLAFHLDDGWSGVLDTNRLQVTHIHCPPPPWDEPNDFANLSYLRNPCWLPFNSIYAVGSLSSDGLYLLDFYPDSTSPCHVDYNEDMQSGEKASIRPKQNRHLSLSESVTACATHPLDGTIVAGTKDSATTFFFAWLSQPPYYSSSPRRQCPPSVEPPLPSPPCTDPPPLSISSNHRSHSINPVLEGWSISTPIPPSE